MGGIYRMMLNYLIQETRKTHFLPSQFDGSAVLRPLEKLLAMSNDDENRMLARKNI